MQHTIWRLSWCLSGFGAYLIWMLHHTEPWYGTVCLYHREKREKLSEDFHFRCLPAEFQDVRLHYNLSSCGVVVFPFVELCLWHHHLGKFTLMGCFVNNVYTGGWWLPTKSHFLTRGTVTSCLLVDTTWEACHRRRRCYSFCLHA